MYYYEINVSYKGTHLFATAERSIETEARYQQILSIIEEKFPEDKGFEVSATHWKAVGKVLKGKYAGSEVTR